MFTSGECSVGSLRGEYSDAKPRATNVALCEVNHIEGTKIQLMIPGDWQRR